MERKRVIELVRVSTGEQAEEDKGGIPAQKAANRRTAELYGLEIVSTVEMIDVSGAAVLREPAMLRLLDEIKRPEIQGVVTRELSRLLRPKDFATMIILDEFKKANTSLYLPEGPLDLESASGFMMNGLRALIGGYELSLIRERSMGGKEALRRMGRWVAGNRQLPYGVDYDRKTYTFSYKPEAEKVREVFRRFLAGDQNYDALSEYLGMTRGTAKNVLQNEIYRGWLVYAEKRDLTSHGLRLKDGKVGRDRKKIDRPESETYRRQVITPGLVSDEEFDRVQKMITQKQELNIRQRTKVGQFTYNGFLWCSKCGARIHTFRNQYDRYYYICKGKKDKNESGEHLCPYTGYMNRDKLEPALDAIVSEILTNEKHLRGIYDRHRKELEASVGKQDRQQLENEYRALYAKRDRIRDLAADGIFTKEECTDRLRKVDETIRLVSDRLIAASPSPNWTPEQVAELFAPCLDWASLDREAKQRILHGLAPRFFVADYNWDKVFLGSVLVASSAGEDTFSEVGDISVPHIDRPNGHPAVAA